MTMGKHLVRVAKFAVVLGAAILIGVAVAFASALLGHEILVLLYGDDLSVIDNTLPMITAVWTCYLAGIVAGLVVLVTGWRRFVRGRTPAT
jgi:UTP-glucose-1-phosphate uridylyltransferase